MINIWNYGMSGIPAEFGEKSQDGDHNSARKGCVACKKQAKQ